MNEKINITALVAPLDWGLGHSTRCIPIIRYLLHKGFRIVIAAEGAQEKLLRQEFPEVEFIHLHGYRISYSSSKRWFALKIFAQLPQILRSIRSEHKWLKHLVDRQKIDLIISDNRYGLFHPGVTGIFITHQLAVQAPAKWLRKMIQHFIYRYINRFSECWIPDNLPPNSLAGKLAHPQQLPALPVHYIGPLSRFEAENGSEKKHDVLVLVSGPEPQRSIFEQIVFSQIPALQQRVLVVRGLPQATESATCQGATVVNHLPAQELQAKISASSIVVCRSGYSTVMDLCALQKKAILVPTPGQTEQEYLADYLQQQGWCHAYHQNNFSLKAAIEKAGLGNFSFPKMPSEFFKSQIDKLADRLLPGLPLPAKTNH